MKDVHFLESKNIQEEYKKNLRIELEKAIEIKEKVLIHIEFLKSLINFEKRGNISIIEAIIFVLKNEEKELNINEIYEKIKKLNLSRPCVEKTTFTSTLGYLKRNGRITNGKQRGYWRITKEEY